MASFCCLHLLIERSFNYIGSLTFLTEKTSKRFRHLRSYIVNINIRRNIKSFLTANPHFSLHHWNVTVGLTDPCARNAQVPEEKKLISVKTPV